MRDSVLRLSGGSKLNPFGEDFDIDDFEKLVGKEYPLSHDRQRAPPPPPIVTAGPKLKPPPKPKPPLAPPAPPPAPPPKPTPPATRPATPPEPRPSVPGQMTLF